ncbi:MAG: acyl-ACP thioesterase [Pseudomonadota bacterium]
MITIWRGSANQWDCDEMGHMNVRVYLDKAMEGLGAFAVEAEMPHAFQQGTPSTLMVEDHHVRFLREVLPGRPLTMSACVLEISEAHAVIYQEMIHGDGSVAAAFRSRVRHAEAKSGKAFPWSNRTRAALERLMGEAPKATAPRSIDASGPVRPAAEVTMAAADAVNAPLIGLGAVPADHCDLHGRMQAAWFMGRISDAVPNLLFDWRKGVAGAAGNGVRMGAAVLEYRLVYRKWPRAGDLIAIRSGLGSAHEKIHSLVHWALDPVSGDAWMTSEAVAVTFDLDTRKTLPTPPKSIAALEELAPKGLSL